MAAGDKNAYVTTINYEKLMDTINRADMILRRTVVFMHPETYKTLKAAEPQIDKNFVFYITDAVDKDKCYVMKREDFENMSKIYEPGLIPFED